MADQVDAGRRFVAAGGAGHPDLADHPGQPEAAGRRAVQVVADHVPPAAPADHAPRLQPPPAGCVPVGYPVVEPDLAAVPGGGGQRRERRVDGDHRLQAQGRLRVHVHAGGAQLGQPGGGGGGQAGVLPQPGGDADGGGLVGLEGDVGQRVLAVRDPVAGLGVEDAGGPGLQRHAQLAQLGLVPLELALERLVVARVVRIVLVAGHGRGDLRGGQEPSRGQQADHQVDQAFGAGPRHG